MTTAAQTATQYAREQSDKRIADRIAEIEASGTTILTPTPELRSNIRANAESVYEEIRANISEELYEAYLGN